MSREYPTLTGREASGKTKEGDLVSYVAKDRDGETVNTGGKQFRPEIPDGGKLTWVRTMPTDHPVAPLYHQASDGYCEVYCTNQDAKVFVEAKSDATFDRLKRIALEHLGGEYVIESTESVEEQQLFQDVLEQYRGLSEYSDALEGARGYTYSAGVAVEKTRPLHKKVKAICNGAGFGGRKAALKSVENLVDEHLTEINNLLTTAQHEERMIRDQRPDVPELEVIIQNLVEAATTKAAEKARQEPLTILDPEVEFRSGNLDSLQDSLAELQEALKDKGSVGTPAWRRVIREAALWVFIFANTDGSATIEDEPEVPEQALDQQNRAQGTVDAITNAWNDGADGPGPLSGIGG